MFPVLFPQRSKLEPADMLEAAKNAQVDILMLTVDTITGGKRERDLKTGFSISFSLNPRWLVPIHCKTQVGCEFLHP